MKLPEPSDLISLFECEPLSDAPGSPWEVSELKFNLDRGVDSLFVSIYAPSEMLKICWKQNGRLRTKLEYRKVSNLAVHTLKNDEFLSASRETGELLKLRIKPEISIEIVNVD